MYSNLWTLFVILLFFARLHNYYYSSISFLASIASFFAVAGMILHCAFDTENKKKTSIRKATNCKAADADAVAAAACVHLLGQLAQSVGNHNKKLILIKRFTCSCRQLRPAARRIGVGVDACVAARVQRERQTERERERA